MAASATSVSVSKAVVVVGVSYMPGLGYAIAKKFASSGHAVGMIGRQQDRLDACRAAILAECPSAKILGAAADVTDPDQCATAFAALRAAHGDPDCLCYNISARPFPPAPVGAIDPSRLESDWKTGPYAALLCVQQVLPAMKAAGTGAILFTGASASLRGSAKFGSFAVNKCGLRALAQSLAREEAPGGVHVAHVVVDAMVDMPVIHDFIEKGFIEAAPGRLLDTGSAADVYWQLYEQDKRCMAFEVDLRPHEAQW
jgi:NAD(P)-dependent dehydrogenase (short-subunit alcohol dehydrogenase family)